jgi:hypothetical protein
MILEAFAHPKGECFFDARHEGAGDEKSQAEDLYNQSGHCGKASTWQ